MSPFMNAIDRLIDNSHLDIFFAPVLFLGSILSFQLVVTWSINLSRNRTTNFTRDPTIHPKNQFVNFDSKSLRASYSYVRKTLAPLRALWLVVVYRRKSLAFAIATCDIACVRLLLEQFNIDANKMAYSWVPLHLAINKGYQACVKLLVEHPNTDVNQSLDGCKPLFIAIYKDETECVRMLLNHPNIDVNTPTVGCAPLHLAVSKSHLACIRLLLAHPNIDVNAVDNGGSTPLHFAIQGNNAESVQALLYHSQIDVNKMRAGCMPPLVVAIVKGCVECFKILLSHPKMDVHKMFSVGNTQYPPLEIFASIHRPSTGQLECLKALTACPSIDVNGAVQGGATPLAIAAAIGNIDVVKFLVALPTIDINKAAPNGNTALHAAAVVLSAHAALNVFTVSCILLSVGADLSLVNHNGQTAIDLLVSELAYDRLERARYQTQSYRAYRIKNVDVLSTARAAFLSMQARNSWTPLRRAAWTSDLSTCLELIRSNRFLPDAETGDGPLLLTQDHMQRSALDMYGTAPFTFPAMNPQQRQRDIAILVTELRARRAGIWTRRWPFIHVFSGYGNLLSVAQTARLLRRDPSSTDSPILRNTKELDFSWFLRAVFGDISIVEQIATTCSHRGLLNSLALASCKNESPLLLDRSLYRSRSPRRSSDRYCDQSSIHNVRT